ncbi:peptide deformylase [Lentzea sp. JNUCC 0626]|uniref:peptide deformylase n=1 Tax=Lentzea sp. JNUCC 0626 TaxID=3367513 RepID=UPI0037479D10
MKKTTRRPARASDDAGRCPDRGKPCRPVNHVVVLVPGSLGEEAYSACGCGKRYPLADDVRRKLRKLAACEAPDGARLPEIDTYLGTRWPSERKHQFAKPGIAPVGTPALHVATRPVGELTVWAGRFGDQMLSAMRRAGGIGLAANQLDVPLRILVHGLARVMSPVLVNACVLEARGSAEARESCLSLALDGSAALVTRPRRVVVRAWTPSGALVVVSADEYLARVLQHEIDHLDGIEYVQRLVGGEQERVYCLMRDHGLPLEQLPPLDPVR